MQTQPGLLFETTPNSQRWLRTYCKRNKPVRRASFVGKGQV
jgi:hypothetical protein